MMEDTFLCFFSLNSQVALGVRLLGYTPASQEVHLTFLGGDGGGEIWTDAIAQLLAGMLDWRGLHSRSTPRYRVGRNWCCGLNCATEQFLIANRADGRK